MGKKSAKKSSKTDKPKEGKKALKERVKSLEKRVETLEKQVSEQLEQLSQRNAAVLRKVAGKETGTKQKKAS